MTSLRASEKKNIFIPLAASFLWRLIIYCFAIQKGHHFEGDSIRWLSYIDDFFSHGTIDRGWNTPGYVILEGLHYKILHWNHYGLLAFQNLFDLGICFLLMREIRSSFWACWAVALVVGFDLASSMYANSIMTETLSSFLISLAWYLAFYRKKIFWGNFSFGLSCLVRAGNWPLFLCFAGIQLFYNRNRLVLLQIVAAMILSLGPLIVANGVRFGDWRLSSQSETHWGVLGGGIIMRQKNISWAQGEQEFHKYTLSLVESGRLPKDLPLGKRLQLGLFIYIKEYPRDFLWSVARGFGTQFFGGQNSEIMHRLQGREIDKEPLPPWLHKSLIAIHALWMLVVWALFIWGIKMLWKQVQHRPLVLFAVVAQAYFFVSVATLGAPRFRIPAMAATALVIGLVIAGMTAKTRRN